MKKIMSLIVMLFVGLSVFAQVDRALIEKAKAREASDPEATKILDAVNEKYESLESMQLEFKLTIKGENESVQEGKMRLKGEQYRLEIADRDVICNGKAVWFHLKDNEEVQINNPDPDGEDFLSPNKMLSIYQENMVGQMLDDTKIDGRVVHQIEIKPRESHDEITKLRVTVDKNTKELVKVTVFTRYADRYIFEFANLVENPKLSDILFNFDVAKFPGIHVEDLRIE